MVTNLVPEPSVSDGFSLIEVMVSLLLLVSILCALLKQEWHMTQRLNQLSQGTVAFLVWSTASESALQFNCMKRNESC